MRTEPVSELLNGEHRGARQIYRAATTILDSLRTGAATAIRPLANSSSSVAKSFFRYSLQLDQRCALAMVAFGPDSPGSPAIQALGALCGKTQSR